MIRLLLVEDHPAIADGVAGLLRAAGDIEVLGIAGEAAGAVALIERQRPDVVLCDVMLGERAGGLELLEADGRGARFLMYSAFDYPAHHRRAVACGAAGYVSKLADTDTLLRAIRRVAAGETAFPDDVLRSARLAPRTPTARELELLELLVGGASNDEMAARMDIRMKTVEGVIRRLFDRYDVGNRTQLARLAILQGWLTSRPGAQARVGAAPARGPGGPHADRRA
jgi:DNA-binding NarL/FixJ family response regulator